MIACSYAESIKANRIYIGAQQQDTYGYWDCTPKYIENMNNVLSLANHELKIIAPFSSMNKSEEIELAIKYNIDLSNTWTCYNGPNDNNEACGTCPSCIERKLSFEKLNMTDPIKYSK
jgi:7-cyano-7-deazaguanine synthase